jgi:hypothetical protein
MAGSNVGHFALGYLPIPGSGNSKYIPPRCVTNAKREQ